MDLIIIMRAYKFKIRFYSLRVLFVFFYHHRPYYFIVNMFFKHNHLF